jgi:glycogen synthase
MEKTTKTKNKLLFEIAWEVCNQVGGIYTVIRSKVPAMVDQWGDDYLCIGPYFAQKAMTEFEPITSDDGSPFYETIEKMRALGYEVAYGYWLVTGKPRVILFDIRSVASQLEALKRRLWETSQIPTTDTEELINQTLLLGEMVRVFLSEFGEKNHKKIDIIAHFHEWMASSGLPQLRQENIKIATVFTTHATMLGRYIAGNETDFYTKLPHYEWQNEARRYGIETQACIERASYLSAHVATTVSDVTARECEVFLGKTPDIVLPNGLNVQRFAAVHEFQNLHLKYKGKIEEFIMGHFFQSYSFDLSKTLYFFTSGRYEFVNKGYDLTLEALARLNYKMVQQNLDMTVVMFFVTRQPYHSINADVLQSRAVLDEIQDNCEAIQEEIGKKLFMASASSDDYNLPDLNDFVDEYWKLRLRRTIQTWKTKRLPPFITHDLKAPDQITAFCQQSGLVNYKENKVKIVYHPDFIASTNPLFGLDYGQFVRGCHLGIFPSYYEPWGYTPLECIVRGIPTVTSDLSGFGDFVMQLMKDYESRGIYVINRQTQGFDKAADQLANILLKFVKLSLKDRVQQRNKVENIADVFDWSSLRAYYDTAHDLALKRKK